MNDTVMILEEVSKVTKTLFEEDRKMLDRLIELTNITKELATAIRDLSYDVSVMKLQIQILENKIQGFESPTITTIT